MTSRLGDEDDLRDALVAVHVAGFAILDQPAQPVARDVARPVTGQARTRVVVKTFCRPFHLLRVPPARHARGGQLPAAHLNLAGCDAAAANAEVKARPVQYHARSFPCCSLRFVRFALWRAADEFEGDATGHGTALRPPKCPCVVCLRARVAGADQDIHRQAWLEHAHDRYGTRASD